MEQMAIYEDKCCDAVMKAFWSTFELQQLFDLIVMPVACDVYFVAALSTCLFSLTTTYTTHTE